MRQQRKRQRQQYFKSNKMELRENQAYDKSISQSYRKKKFCIGKAVSHCDSTTQPHSETSTTRARPHAFSPRTFPLNRSGLSGRCLNSRHDDQPYLPCAADARLYVFPIFAELPGVSRSPAGPVLQLRSFELSNLTDMFQRLQLSTGRMPSSES